MFNCVGATIITYGLEHIVENWKVLNLVAGIQKRDQLED